MISGGNSFRHFPENQLTMTLHVFASLLGGTLHRSPLSWYQLGERRSPAFHLDYTTALEASDQSPMWPLLCDL